MQTAGPDAAALPVQGSRLVAFLRDRWQRRVPLARLFWRDLVFYATLLNLCTAMAALLVFTSDLPGWVGLVVFFLPLPYNLFLVASVWRTAGARTDLAAWAYQLFAALWLMATLLI
jgi:hypothetical protein